MVKQTTETSGVPANERGLSVPPEAKKYAEELSRLYELCHRLGLEGTQMEPVTI